jgi:hypothetical protein
MNITDLRQITKLLSTNPNGAKELVKLLTFNVVKSLENNNYSILSNNKNFIASSQTELKEGQRYWGTLSDFKSQTPKLSSILAFPSLVKTFEASPIKYQLKNLELLLLDKNKVANLKESVLEKISQSSSKEEFIALSNTLLSFENGVFTIPTLFHGYFHLLQFKKRYNKESKKFSLNFYAALETLGPISGVITLSNSNLFFELSVAFEKTKTILEEDAKNFSYNVNISVAEEIRPLFNTDTNSILDISV